ncbi:MAG TPA: ABC transporter permease [Candidatus Dormibacteraeota bacterium]|nr:ABC transporter permease [Candidatus Dormibacteraeota bacterium]
MRRAFDLRGFLAVLYKEVKHVTRDPVTLALALALPVVQLLLFGYAINTKVQHIGSAYLDEDRGALSVRALDALRASDQFDLVYRATSRAQLRALIVAGRVRVAFDIAPNFTADVRSGRPGEIQVLIDGSDSSVAQQAFAASTAIGSALSAALGPGTRGASVAPTLVDVRPRMLFNPSLRSANFLVPGLIGVIMQVITIFLMSLSIVGERERGTLEQLLVTPIGPLGLMLGKIVPYACIGFVDFLFVLGAMRWIFGVPIAGSLPLLLVLGAGFLMAALGLGLWVSAVARTQVQAMLMTFALTMPSILLSGFFFERDLMPPVMQWVGYLIPLTYFLEILRGIVLRGAGISALWPSVTAMMALGTGLVIFASIRFARSTS